LRWEGRAAGSAGLREREMGQNRPRALKKDFNYFSILI
jgi:hypothetical protein